MLFVFLGKFAQFTNNPFFFRDFRKILDLKQSEVFIDAVEIYKKFIKLLGEVFFYDILNKNISEVEYSENNKNSLLYNIDIN